MTNVLSTFVKCVCVNSYDYVHVFCNVNQDGGQLQTTYMFLEKYRFLNLLKIPSTYRFLGVPKKAALS